MSCPEEIEKRGSLCVVYKPRVSGFYYSTFNPLNQEENLLRMASDASSASPPINPWTRCLFFLPRKNRYCTVPRAPGARFCGNHVEEGRVPCPVDPSHTVLSSDVARHMSRCTDATRAARIAALPCFAAKVNEGSAPLDELLAIHTWRKAWDSAALGDTASNPHGLPHRDLSSNAEAVTRMLSAIPRADFFAFADRVAHWCRLHCDGQRDRAQREPAHLSPATTKLHVNRHSRQADYLVDAMDRASLFHEPARDLLLVEFGAGKGLLGVAALRHALPRCSSSQLILLERGVNRYKADRTRSSSRDATPHSDDVAQNLLHRVHRMRMDIADFVLQCHPASHGVPLSEFANEPPWRGASGHSIPRDITDVPSPEKSSLGCAGTAHNGASIVAVGKHLCGAATDLALRCVLNATSGASAVGSAAGDSADVTSCVVDCGFVGPSAPTLQGIAIATCCHHACSWEHYVGKLFMRDVLGASSVDFELMRMISSWGLLGPSPAQGLGATPSAPAGVSETGPFLDEMLPLLDRARRITLGQQCKSLLDEGRARFLLTLLPSHRTSMTAYCPGSDSPENMVLMAGREAASA